jgi:hypothetical protein
MNWTSRVIISGLSLLLCFEALGETSAADFAGIARKNAFRLNPPKPETKPDVIQAALPQINLRGLTTLPGVPQAVLGIQNKGTSGNAEVFCRLGEGQTEAGVTVLRIDMTSATVWIANSGVEQVLSLRD